MEGVQTCKNKVPTPIPYRFAMPLLSDELWPKLEKILLQHAIYNKPHLRTTVEGMLYRMRAGCPWRDLPRAFGCWNAIYKRFNAWSAAGRGLKNLQSLAD
ncbi:hypothetical protein HNQ59_002836 [Chitinivorax tropicus]|uniref:Insertion element IS402-like domain-containing protein n=1 Tax=Chitinivorax tropicus TaxID=714531 RepID=A0A840MK13_9PROT|nr:hypothetical protein [Chitinivorax tropicus]